MADAQTAPVVDAEALGRMIAQGIASGLKEIAPPRKVEFGEFNGKSPFDRKKDGTFYAAGEKPALNRPSFQNGVKFREEYLTAEEINLLNQITIPGRYIERKVEVVIFDEGSDQSIDLRYKNKTPDQRSELKSEAKDLVAICRRIIEEQTEAELDDATSPRKRK